MKRHTATKGRQKVEIVVGKLIDRRGSVFIRAARRLYCDPEISQAGTALAKCGAGMLDFMVFAHLYQPGDFADKNHRIWALLFADEASKGWA